VVYNNQSVLIGQVEEDVEKKTKPRKKETVFMALIKTFLIWG